jgi:hypothetical protein
MLTGLIIKYLNPETTKSTGFRNFVLGYVAKCRFPAQQIRKNTTITDKLFTPLRVKKGGSDAASNANCQQLTFFL